MTLADGHMLSAIVAGRARYIPTLDPAHSPFVILSLATLRYVDPAVQVGEAWLRTEPGATTLLDHRSVPEPFVPRDNLLQTGLYGVASIGFLVAMLLSLVGFLAHTLLSLRRRLEEFSVLRALGFSGRQVGLALLTEQLVLVVAGAGCGLFAGAAASWLSLPYLPIVEFSTPPFSSVSSGQLLPATCSRWGRCFWWPWEPVPG